MSAAQDVVHGAWTRRSASVSGSEHFETHHVIWLQAGTCYADIRVPFCVGAVARCFTGRSGWDGDRYRWRRHLDLEPVPGEDVGDLSWVGGALVERGMFPTPKGEVPYEEVWVHMTRSEGLFIALEAPAACLVRTGHHAITVVDGRPGGGDLAAAYRFLGASGWALAHAVGGGAASLPDPDDDVDWPVIHRGTTEPE